MNTSDREKCKRCGAAVPAQSTQELCPACLMSGALEPDGGTFGSLWLTSAESPSFDENSDFPFEFGGYRLLGFLGRGGMGTVYEAEELATGRRVALKMLSQQLDSADLRQRFLREGRLAASVNHPNSLYVFGSEEIEGVPVITMEIAGSGTLKDKLEKRGPLPVAEAVDAVLEVIAGLEAAFAGGVLHRDIKPSNCFVGPDGSVKVGDFGLSVSTLAKEDSYATAAGLIMGTPAYAPPEQLRGDALDVRADIYSVGATLFTLLTGQAPFDGSNAIQVVANAVNKPPRPLAELREDVPSALARVVARCLAKEPAGRYDDYPALRDALLPFGSGEPEPASIKIRVSAGWIDYLIAFLIPYVILMLTVGNEEFHFRFFMEKTLHSARHHIALIVFGLLYFSIVEGIWGAGLGKRLKGLRVVRADGRRPGIGRALTRILVQVLCIECVRIPLLLATIAATRIDDLTLTEILLYSGATTILPWIPVAFTWMARRGNGFATFWDLVSGTRVVVKPKGTVRASVEPAARPEMPAEEASSFGPFAIVRELVPGQWMVATDPVLRRPIWLLRETSAAPSEARRNVARPGRLRWLQRVEAPDTTWDAFEAPRGVPFVSQVAGEKRVPWGTLRDWIHDLASELWAATGDRTLPATLSLDHVWITATGRAVLLDEPWPEVENAAERTPVADVAGQQRFLSTIAAWVESTGLPLHARPVLQNLEAGRFEKLSFFTGTLRGLLGRPAEVSKGIRAASIFLLPTYVWIMVFVGTLQGAVWLHEMAGGGIVWLAMATALSVLAGCALTQILTLPFRTTVGHTTFRLAAVNDRGEPAAVSQLFARWAVVWLPLFIPIALAALLIDRAETVALVSALVVLLLWIGAAAHAVAHPNRGWHDRLARTWVVRR